MYHVLNEELLENSQYWKKVGEESEEKPTGLILCSITLVIKNETLFFS